MGKRLWQLESPMDNVIRHYRGRHWDFLQKLARLCDRQGGRAFLVGGCVRSALLGEAVTDFDVEIFGMEAETLEPVLSELAPVMRVGKAFGIYKLSGWPVDVGLPRTERKTGTGHRGFSVTIDPRLSLEEAARRRDFTVNALYLDIRSATIEDPLGGMADLEKRCLRHCSDRFPEDPLRVLRAMQFAARLPGTVAPETVALCRSLSPEGLSPERFLGEWEKLLLQGKEPSRGLFFLRDCGWLAHFPELEAMSGCPQDPRWHPEGDVYTHTARCLDAFVRFRTGDREDDLTVGFAVLCHDMGKPRTTEILDGRITSYGHEAAGLKPARRFLERLKVSARIIEKVLPLVKCHMRPAMLHADRSKPAAVQRLARDAGRLDLLLRVFQSDAGGRPPYPDTSREAVDWIREKALELNVGNKGPASLLRGHDLLERGWKPGPGMGRILNKAYELQLDGHLSDREEALSWLDRQRPDQSEPTRDQPGSAKS